MLVEETIKRYGYDPRTLSRGSHKEVLYRCGLCEEIRSIRIRYYKENMICKPCPKRAYKQDKEPVIKWKAKEKRDPATLHPQIDREETFKRFGYYPEELTPMSAKEIVWRCAVCEEYRESRERQLKNNPALCHTCSNRKKRRDHNTKVIASGLAPNGKPLGQRDKTRYRIMHTIWRRKWRQTSKGRLINRLRVALKRALGGGSTKVLPYTTEVFIAHIQARLAARNYICPLCNVADLHQEYDVDHRVPLSSATTTEDVVKLFELSNLDVLCPPCNQFRKGDKFLEY